MHAVMAGMLGISELHRRNASLVHICCASALKAKLALDDSAEKETAKAATNPARRVGSAAAAFRGRGSVWMTYGDGRHPVSSIDELEPRVLPLAMTTTPAVKITSPDKAALARR
jgi:hypothetical protein